MIKSYVDKRLLRFTRRLAHRLGYDLHRPAFDEPPRDVTSREVEIARQVRPYTMTSFDRLIALIQAVEYVVRENVPGGIVECGVWRGGSMMAVAKILLDLGRTDRRLYLFDTFSGMTEPGPQDGSTARNRWEANAQPTHNQWCYATLAEVTENLISTGYPAEMIGFVQGNVEETIPAFAPKQISLLRLDTDFYESTRHELEHLYPRLSTHGVLIVDDYGHWVGCRKAVDEFVQKLPAPLFLARIDYTARLAIKPPIIQKRAA